MSTSDEAVRKNYARKKVNPTKKKSVKEVKSADSIKKNHESFKGQIMEWFRKILRVVFEKN